VVRVTLVIAIALITIGLLGYAWSGYAATTALIPAFFGVPILALGLVARRECWRKHAMHAALVVSLFGILGAAPMAAKGWATAARGETLERPVALAVQSSMTVLCLAHVALGVSSFIAARRKPASA